jgi:hypothetical protein
MAKRGWINTPEGPRPTDQRMLEIVFQIEGGRPYELIAAQFGISCARVSRISRKLGRPDGRRGPRRSRIDSVNNFHRISAI